METQKALFESIAPPDYKVQKVLIRGILIINGNPQLKYRLLTYPHLNEQSVWACQIITRVCYDGAIKEVAEGLIFDGPFSIHASNFFGAADVWTLNLG